VYPQVATSDGPLLAMSSMGDWSPADSAELYRVEHWGQPYFGVSSHGTVEVYPTGDPAVAIDLHDVVEGLLARDLHPPVVIRFPDILKHRMQMIRSAFDEAISENGYAGRYQGVYPIKVNQQRHLCEDVRNLASEFDFGIEVGSKPELIAGLGLTAGLSDMPLVCNGFKDAEFIETVVLASKMGRNVIPVVEQAKELRMITELAAAHGVRPKIAMRARLTTSGIGRWASSAGIRGKFGLTISEMLDAVDHLRRVEMLDSLYMLHCHIGSQIFDIHTVKDAVREIAYLYVQLVGLGAPIKALNLGGGMGVDYDGSQTATASSVNYTVEQYAADVVHRIQTICDEAGIAHPDIVTESGRALVTHSSLLVFDVLGARRYPNKPDHDRLARALAEESPPQPLLDLLAAYKRLEDEALAVHDLAEIFADAEHAFEESKSLFSLGHMDIFARAAAEGLYWATGHAVVRSLGDDLPEDLAGLSALLGDVYFANVSVFQSLLDSWGIKQLFPIMPIHRLDEEPTRRATLADITCDSDGRIDRFAGADGPVGLLPLHPLSAPDGTHEPYYLGVFLTGAYQEALGDLHNLLGDPHVVHVGLGPEGRWQVDAVVDGDTVGEVLEYVEYDTPALRKTLLRNVENAVERGTLSGAEGTALRRFFDQAVEGYSYLE